MVSSAFEASTQPLLHSASTNNQNNYGLIGDGSNNFVNSGIIIGIGANDSEDGELDRLLDGHISKDALHDSFYSPPECHLNTRTTVRNVIGQWTDESGSEKSPLLWLNGPVGVGKSVIAKTIAASHDQVVATFFFSTSSDRSASTLSPTLAWQLGRRFPDTRKHIICSLKNSGSLQTAQIEEQFNRLILQPLKNTTTLKYRPVMVIDGVDECIDESMLERFLRVLVRAGEGGGMPLRFIICSRPEPRIHAILGRAHDVTPTANGQKFQFPSLMHKVLDIILPSYRLRYRGYFHPERQQSRGFTKFLKHVWELYRPIRLGVDKDASSPSDTRDDFTNTLDRICPHRVTSTIQIGFSEECKEDIARYLTDRFSAIPRPGDTSAWFQPSDISDLVEASCGQFLYASTIARLLDEPHFDPRDVFEMAHRGSLPTPDLNKLYKVILKRAQDTIRQQAQDGGPDYQMEWRFVMDSLTILVMFAGNVRFFTVSKSFPVIESLLGLEMGKLTRKLGKMHSVLRVIPGESVQVHHRSFLEFLQSRERSREYYISSSTAVRRILILMVQAGVRCNSFQNIDNRRLHIQDITIECRRNFFARSRFPKVLDFLHNLIHILTILPLLLLFSSLVPLSLSVPPAYQLMLLFLGFAGAFILSLTTYLLFFSRCIIVPFFHPFLHPFFVFTGGFLVPSGLLPLLLVSIVVVLLVDRLGLLS